ncbi:MAG: hypothetical protein ACKO37_02000 [Vampirovibrionales bacterium]
MSEFKKEWLQKADIDYFAPFLLLWLAFNSWYKDHYHDIENPTDRKLIDLLKCNDSNRSKPFKNFKGLLERSDRLSTQFRSDLESFHRVLLSANLIHDKAKYVNLNKAIIKWESLEQESTYKDLFVDSSKKGVPKIKLIDLTMINDLPTIFAGVLECLYLFRNLLVHGHIEPNKDNNEVAEYAYKLLKAIMP